MSDYKQIQKVLDDKNKAIDIVINNKDVPGVMKPLFIGMVILAAAEHLKKVMPTSSLEPGELVAHPQKMKDFINDLSEKPDYEKASDKAFDEMMKPAKEYWIVDGTHKTYDLREEIKSWGGYFVNDHKCWAITDPCASAKNVFLSSGLKLQFRREV